MTTLMLLALLNQAQPSVAAQNPPEPSYSLMTREQLLRERTRLVDERPSGAVLAFAWIGTVLSIGGAGVSIAALLSVGGLNSLGAVYLLTTVASVALAVVLIYYIATRTPVRRRIGNELDVIDDLLDHPQPAQPVSLWPKNPVPMMTLARF